MTLQDVLNVCRARGVRLAIQGGELRAQGRPGAVSEALQRGLAEHKQSLVETLGDGIWLADATLPDELVIPKTARPLEEIAACIDSQRVAVPAVAAPAPRPRLRFPTLDEARRLQGRSTATWRAPTDVREGIADTFA